MSKKSPTMRGRKTFDFGIEFVLELERFCEEKNQIEKVLVAAATWHCMHAAPEERDRMIAVFNQWKREQAGLVDEPKKLTIAAKLTRGIKSYPSAEKSQG